MTVRVCMIAAGALLLGSLGSATGFSQPPQTSPANPFAPGMEVIGPGGAEVGKVEKVEGSYLTVATDHHQARLPIASFTPSKGKLLFGLTREQLNQEIEKSLSKLAQSLTKGTDVRGAAGSVAGTIEDLDDQFLTLRLPSGTLIKLPRTAVGAGANGPTLGISGAELDRLAAQAQTQSGS